MTLQEIENIIVEFYPNVQEIKSQYVLSPEQRTILNALQLLESMGVELVPPMLEQKEILQKHQQMPYYIKQELNLIEQLYEIIQTKPVEPPARIKTKRNVIPKKQPILQFMYLNEWFPAKGNWEKFMSLLGDWQPQSPILREKWQKIKNSKRPQRISFFQKILETEGAKVGETEIRIS